MKVPWSRLRVESLVTAACVLGLLAMALMCWSVLDPTPFPVMVAMSVGQVIGTLSLLSYVGAVLLHGVQRRRERQSLGRKSA
jgi:ABC-type dipeptide/oligopeptide/nickel transport system permease subunit